MNDLDCYYCTDLITLNLSRLWWMEKFGPESIEFLISGHSRAARFGDPDARDQAFNAITRALTAVNHLNLKPGPMSAR